MAKYRLITLNLDDAAIERISKSSNKSAFVRIVVNNFDKRNQEFDALENLYIRYLSAIRHLAEALAEAPETDFLAEYMDETPLAITKMCDAGYLDDALIAAAIRHGSP